MDANERRKLLAEFESADLANELEDRGELDDFCDCEDCDCDCEEDQDADAAEFIKSMLPHLRQLPLTAEQRDYVWSVAGVIV